MKRIKQVIAIPATFNRDGEIVDPNKPKLRVAAYARVSTDKDDQFTSYEAQIQYYTNYITRNPEWELVKIYTDEGISGTSIKKRKGFLEMVEDGLNGKIDLIVTKSISRFSRNTLDFLAAIRKLKAAGCYCFFEKENANTSDAKGEVLMTIMSALAQDESRSISQNVTWGMRKRAADGKTHVPFSIFLGYDKGPDNTFVVNKEQAKIVKRIYDSFLNGLTCYDIAKMLTTEGVKTAGGGDNWHSSTIKSILTNEKYKGDCICQKTYRKDFLTGEIVHNKGEIPQYYVEDDHEAIINRDTWEMVQIEFRRRGHGQTKHSTTHLFCGIVKCGECGGWYGPKVWHPGKPYEELIWICNEKYKKNKERCLTPVLRENEIKDYFVKGFNELIKNKKRVLEKLNHKKVATLSTDKLICNLDKKKEDMESLYEIIEKLVDGSNYYKQKEEIRKMYVDLVGKYDKTRNEIDDIKLEIAERNYKIREIDYMVEIISNINESIIEFDEALFCKVVEYITIYSKEDVKVMFRGGIEVIVGNME